LSSLTVNVNAAIYSLLKIAYIYNIRYGVGINGDFYFFDVGAIPRVRGGRPFAAYSTSYASLLLYFVGATISVARLWRGHDVRRYLDVGIVRMALRVEHAQFVLGTIRQASE
jgi:hypothetical protein